MIQVRFIRDSMTMAKRRGNPSWGKSVSEAAKRAADLLPVIAGLREEGIDSLLGMAARLNERGISAPRGGQWTAAQVSRVLKIKV